MANSVQERLKLKRISLDTWSTREKLCLASSVQRSGDQNWSCVSRNIKTFSEPNRPADWFSQKNCAQQYAGLLENVETPKRKKRSAGSTDRTEVETPGESIVRKLTDERVFELKKIMADTQAEYLKILDECNALCCGEADDKIPQFLQEIENDKLRKEQEKEAHVRWLREREERRIELERAWRPNLLLSSLRRESSLSEPSSDADSPLSEPLAVDVPDELVPKVTSTATPTSPLLTSLLKSPAGVQQHGSSPLFPPPSTPSAPSSILHSAITSPMRGVSPTIASLLNSSPVSSMAAPLGMPPGNVSPNLKSLVSSALAIVEDQKRLVQSPSQGAPTLSMLLELPPSMPGKPLPVLQVQPPAPPPYSEHLGPPPPYSLATEYLQKQRAEQAAQAAQSQAQLAIENVEKELLMPTMPMLPQDTSPLLKQSLKPDILVDLDDIEEVIAVDTSRSQLNTSDHDYSEPRVPDMQLVELPEEPKTGKKELDVFEFGEEEENDAKISYLKSNAKRLAKKEACKLVSPTKAKSQEGEGAEEVAVPQEEMPIPQVSELKDMQDEAEQPTLEEITGQEETATMAVDEGELAQEEKATSQDVELGADKSEEVKKEIEDNEVEVKAQLMEAVPSEKIEEAGDLAPADEISAPAISEIKDRNEDDGDPATADEVSTSAAVQDFSAHEDDKSNETLAAVAAAAAVSGASVRRRRLTASLSAPDSVPNSPLSFTEEEKEYRAWKKSVQMVQMRIEGHKSASLFLKPITDEQAPDYSSIVLRPMDLSTIKRNLEAGVIRTTEEYQRDIMLMFFNARMYNKTDDVVYEETVNMQKDSLEHIQVLIELRGEAPPSRRETRTHDKTSTTRQSRSSVKAAVGAGPTAGLKRKRASLSSSSDGARKKLHLEES